MTMRTFVLLGCFSLAACTPGATPQSVPDSRLGTLMFEVDARDAHLDAPSPVRFYFVSHAYTRDGTLHLLAATRTTRHFGVAEWEESKVFYRVASPDGVVREVTAPDLSFPTIGAASLTFSQDGQQPVLLFSGLLPGGQLFTAWQFDGTAWKRIDFLRKDRPDGDSEIDFAADGQLRVPSNGSLLIQHAGRVISWQGSSWTEVARPANAVDLRLGRYGKDGLRAWWVDARGELFTDSLKTDLTWAGKVERLGLPGMSFGAFFGHSGTGDVHTLHVTADDQVMVLRYVEGAGFRVVLLREPTSAERAAKGTALLSLEHPYRSLEQDPGSRELFANYLGKPFGSLGIISPQEATVSCDPTLQCAVPDGGWALEGPDCGKCVPRTMSIRRFSALPDLSGVGLVQVDTFDAISRLYVKKISLPAVEGYAWKPFAAGSFPGDDGIVDDDVTVTSSLLRLRGRFLIPGAADHTGIKVVLSAVDGSVDPQTVITGVDGEVSFPGVAAGNWRLDVTQRDYVSWSRTFTAADTGVIDVGAQVLVNVSVEDAGFDPALTSAYSVVNNGLLQWGGGVVQVVRNGAMTVLTRQLASGTRPVETQAGLAWNEGTCPGAGCTVVASPAAPIPAMPVDRLRSLGTAWAWPDGPIDRVTPRQWSVRSGSSSIPWVIAYDVEPDNRCGGYSWEVSGDGGVQPYVLRDCQVNGLRLPVYSPDPLLVTQARTQPGIGFDAPDCGAAGNWRTGCKLFFMFDVTGRKLSDSGIYGVVTQQAFGFWLEQPAPGAPFVLANYSVQADRRVDIATNLTLPSWGPGERPFYLLLGGEVFIRVGTGLYKYPSSGTARQLVLDNVVAVHSYKVGNTSESLVVHHRATPGTNCNDAKCKVSFIDGNTLAVREVASTGATGKEAFFNGGVLLAQSWPGCPGGPCQAIMQSTSSDSPLTPLARGSLWPDRTQTWVPYEAGFTFLRTEGSTQLPSGL